MVLLDSMAWRFEDSIPVRLPRHEGLTDTSDLDNFMLANAYEVYFKRPVVVDSSFIVAGTLRNNGVIRPIIEWLENIPIRYPVIWEIAHCDTCPPNDLYLVYSDDTAGNIGPDGFHYLEEHPLIGYFHCGPFFAIVDTASYSITVLSDDRSSADGIKDAPGVMNETASPLKASMAAMDLAFLCLIAVVWTCSCI